MSDRLALSPTEVAHVLGVSRPTVYGLLRRDDFPSFKVGSRTLVPVKGLRDWVERQTQGGDVHGEN